MSVRTAYRRLVDPDYATARPSIPLPLPLDVDLAPQLLVVALVQAALAAAHRAFDSAHPVLATTSRLTEQPNLTDSEHFAVLAMHAGSQLAELLSEYATCVIRDNIDPDDFSSRF
jgi:hypothetical protein